MRIIEGSVIYWKLNRAALLRFIKEERCALKCDNHQFCQLITIKSVKATNVTYKHDPHGSSPLVLLSR